MVTYTSVWRARGAPMQATMGHIEQRLIAELATLNQAEQASLLAHVERLKAERSAAAVQGLTAAQGSGCDALAAQLASFRIALGGYKFDRAEANAR